jgi:molybdopterin synthase sulfur carrier subunit
MPGAAMVSSAGLYRFSLKIYVEDMSLKVSLYGITRDIVGTSVIELPAPAPATVGELLAEMRKQYPALGELRSCAVAVNHEYASHDQLLRTVDEIALIPPVAGG